MFRLIDDFNTLNEYTLLVFLTWIISSISVLLLMALTEINVSMGFYLYEIIFLNHSFTYFQSPGIHRNWSRFHLYYSKYVPCSICFVDLVKA